MWPCWEIIWNCHQVWVAGLIWSEIKQLWDVGLKEYVSDMWNVVDFITNSLYVATIGLRLRAYYDVSWEYLFWLELCFCAALTTFMPHLLSWQGQREKWGTYFPMVSSPASPISYFKRLTSNLSTTKNSHFKGFIANTTFSVNFQGILIQVFFGRSEEREYFQQD